jgi:hypothetical protein
MNHAIISLHSPSKGDPAPGPRDKNGIIHDAEDIDLLNSKRMPVHMVWIFSMIILFNFTNIEEQDMHFE